MSSLFVLLSTLTIHTCCITYFLTTLISVTPPCGVFLVLKSLMTADQWSNLNKNLAQEGSAWAPLEDWVYCIGEIAESWSLCSLTERNFSIVTMVSNVWRQHQVRALHSFKLKCQVWKKKWERVVEGYDSLWGFYQEKTSYLIQTHRNRYHEIV